MSYTFFKDLSGKSVFNFDNVIRKQVQKEISKPKFRGLIFCIPFLVWKIIAKSTLDNSHFFEAILFLCFNHNIWNVTTVNAAHFLVMKLVMMMMMMMGGKRIVKEGSENLRGYDLLDIPLAGQIQPPDDENSVLQIEQPRTCSTVDKVANDYTPEKRPFT